MYTYRFYFVAKGWTFSDAFTVNSNFDDLASAYKHALKEFLEFHERYCKYHSFLSFTFAVFYEDLLDDTFAEPMLFTCFGEQFD